MAITLTVSVCEFMSSFSRWLYMFYYLTASLAFSGTNLIQPKVYINGFGHENLVLIHGLILFMGIPFTLVDTFLTPELLKYVQYTYTFMILNVFSVVSLIALYLSNGKDSNGKNI